MCNLILHHTLSKSHHQGLHLVMCLKIHYTVFLGVFLVFKYLHQHVKTISWSKDSSMKLLSSVALMFLLVVQFYIHICKRNYGLTYRQLEKGIVTYNNTKTLHENLCPVNDHKKFIMNITYQFVCQNTEIIFRRYPNILILTWLFVFIGCPLQYT